MFTNIIFILHACLLIALVVTNPILQEVNFQAYPSVDFDQTVYRNSLRGSPNVYDNRNTDSNNIPVSVPSHLAPACTIYQQNNQLKKNIYERVMGNPAILDILGGINNGNDAKISNHIQHSQSIPSIVNNYIILPSDYLEDTKINKQKDNYTPESIYNNPSASTRVKKNINKNIIQAPKSVSNNPLNLNESTKSLIKIPISNHQQETPGTTIRDNKATNNTSNKKNNLRKTLKRSLHKKHKSKYHTLQHSSNEESEKITKNKLEDNKIIRQRDMKKLPPDLNSITPSTSKNNEINIGGKHTSNLKKNTTSTKNERGLLKKHGVVKSDEKQQDIKIGDMIQKNYTKRNNFSKHKDINTNAIEMDNNKHISDHKNITKNVLSVRPHSHSYQISNIPDDNSNIYKFIEALLSNYQLTNTHFNSDFPLNFKNIYQVSQPSVPWESINKSKIYRRRKQPRPHGRRPYRKRVNSKNKHAESKMSTPHNTIGVSSSDDITSNLNTKKSLQKFTTRKTEESVKLSETFSKHTNTTSIEEPENSFINAPNEFLFNNNTFTEESSYHNSYPSFILGMEDTVPIIFENDLVDDYYPDFTADNDIFHMTTETNTHGKYQSTKYNYVSNQNFNFKNHIDQKSLHPPDNQLNMNKHSNLFSSENDGSHDKIITTNKGNMAEEKIEGLVEFQSPPILDNPDFRTRKIDSNENYEPYYYHNVYQNPDDDFTKYYLDDTALVYSTSLSSKSNTKSKLCNEIDNTSTAKGVKVKDKNVETVYARSKLAKYGQTL